MIRDMNEIENSFTYHSYKQRDPPQVHALLRAILFSLFDTFSSNISMLPASDYSSKKSQAFTGRVGDSSILPRCSSRWGQRDQPS